MSETDWSGRHTRLRYQSVLSAILFATVTSLGITKVSLPGFFDFESVPPDWIARGGTLFFALFSLVSFVLQDIVEKQLRHDLIVEARGVVKLFSDSVQRKSTFSRLEGALESYLNTLKMNVEVEEEHLYWVDKSLMSEVLNKASVEVKVAHASSESALSVCDDLRKLFPNQSALFKIYQERVGELKSLVETIRLNSNSQRQGDPIVGYPKNNIESVEKVRDHLDGRRHSAFEISIKVLKLLRKRSFLTKLHSRALMNWIPATVSTILIVFGTLTWALK